MRHKLWPADIGRVIRNNQQRHKNRGDVRAIGHYDITLQAGMRLVCVDEKVRLILRDRDGEGALVHAHMYTEPPSPTDVRPDLPAPVEDIIMELLEKEPNARPPSAVSVLSRLGSRRGEPGSGEWD